MLKKVVLPAPFGPMIETIERGGTEKLTSSTATRPPKILETFAESRIVARPSDRRRRAAWRLRARAAVDAARSCPFASKMVSSPGATPSVSSIFRLRSGIRPCGRSTIMITIRKPKIPKLSSVRSKCRPTFDGSVVERPGMK